VSEELTEACDTPPRLQLESLELLQSRIEYTRCIRRIGRDLWHLEESL
jgi:hypothetical protein